jgi:hypothetical protein
LLPALYTVLFKTKSVAYKPTNANTPFQREPPNQTALPSAKAPTAVKLGQCGISRVNKTRAKAPKKANKEVKRADEIITRRV